MNAKKIPEWFPKVGDEIELFFKCKRGCKNHESKRCKLAKVVREDSGNIHGELEAGRGSLDYWESGLPGCGHLIYDPLFDTNRTDPPGCRTMMIYPVRKIVKHWQMSKVLWPRPKKTRKVKA